MLRIACCVALCVLLEVPIGRAEDVKKANDAAKEVAGTAEFLRGSQLLPEQFQP